MTVLKIRPLVHKLSGVVKKKKSRLYQKNDKVTDVAYPSFRRTSLIICLMEGGGALGGADC